MTPESSVVNAELQSSAICYGFLSNRHGRRKQATPKGDGERQLGSAISDCVNSVRRSRTSVGGAADNATLIIRVSRVSIHVMALHSCLSHRTQLRSVWLKKATVLHTHNRNRCRERITWISTDRVLH
jgi:hypothetical protein